MLKHALGLSNDELYDVFAEWNRGELNSYLIEITRDIFSVKDPETGKYLVDLILDTAGAKGTGKWMSQLALDLGVPSTLVTEAVYARCLSAMKDARVRASKVLGGPSGQLPRRPRRSSSSRSARPSTPRRSAATPRASCSCRPPPPSTTGRWTSAPSPCSGAAAASSAPSSSNGSRKPSTPTRSSKTCSWPPTSPRPSTKAQAAWRNVVATAVAPGHPGPGLRHGPGLLRRLPLRAPAGQPAPGPARLLRRPHLPAHRQAKACSTPTGSRPASRPSNRPARHYMLPGVSILAAPDGPLQELTMAKGYLDELFGLEGQVAVVIGGAGVLGGALCRGIARAGAHVVVGRRDRGRLQAPRSRNSMPSAPGASYVPVDVTKRESIERLAGQSRLKVKGRVEILVNCAGVNAGSTFLDATDADWDRVMTINLTVGLPGLPGLRPATWSQSGGGAILNIGSVTSHLPLSRVFAYSASKAGVVNLTRTSPASSASRASAATPSAPASSPPSRTASSSTRSGSTTSCATRRWAASASPRN